MGQAGTVLIAVGDGTLADSLRFSLELEGYETRFCDERAISPLLRSPCLHGACMVLDHDVFSQVAEAGDTKLPCDPCVPVILMVSQKTDRLLAKAKTGGVTTVLEKPVLGGLMLETIRQVIENNEDAERPVLPS